MFRLSLIFGNYFVKSFNLSLPIYLEKRKYQETFKKVFFVLGFSQNEASGIFYSSKRL